MDKVEFIKRVLETYLENWKKLQKENTDNSYYRGAIASLEGFKNIIELEFEKNAQNKERSKKNARQTN